MSASYRLTRRSLDLASFASFELAIEFARALPDRRDLQLVNDARNDGGARQGLTEAEYFAWLEVA